MRALCAVIMVLALLASAPPSASGQTLQPVSVTAGRGEGPGNRIYRPPVDAPVTDPFRPPPESWSPGNRGIEYATVPGTPVRAIGPGAVVFAGPVAGALYVTILHPDGLRSSYSYLAALRVRVGQRVRGGAVVGIAGDRFHVGVRRGRTYLDPASLWGTRVRGGRVILVPLDGEHRSRSARSRLGPRRVRR